MAAGASRAAANAASLWQPLDAAAVLAPRLAAASPGAQDLLAKLVVAADTAVGSGGCGFAAQWLRAKLAGLGRAQVADGTSAPGALVDSQLLIPVCVQRLC